ncbi:MAG: hypothetical protein ACP6IP_07960 [Candidatus Njordarchaeia archaeon]
MSYDDGYNAQLSALISALNALTSEMSRLKGINESQLAVLNRLLATIIEIEVVKARAESSLNQRIVKLVEERLSIALSRFKAEYIDIIRDFTNDVLTNLEHFVKLVEEELAPLRKIVESMKRLLDDIESVNPIEEDMELLEEAIRMYDGRKAKAFEYLGAEEEIYEMIRKIRDTKIKFVKNLSNFILKKVRIEDERGIVYIPAYVIKVRKKDGSVEKFLIPFSKARETKDILEELVSPMNISQRLEEKINKSLQRKERKIRFEEVDEKVKTEAKKLAVKKTQDEKEVELIAETLG